MRKLLEWFEIWFVWLFSRRVLAAINSGAEYDEVSAVVAEEVERNFPSGKAGKCKK